jgi:transposase
MDNATFHKRQDSVEALRRDGKIPEYLPTYSPDLNPVEHKWAQAKALRRRLQCPVDVLFTGPLL